MGVDLNIWALNPKNKTYIIFSLERTSGFWNDLKELESVKIPTNFYEYEAYEWYDYNASKKQTRRGSKKHDLLVRKRKVTNRKLQIDGYGKELVSIKAIYLQLLILDDSIRFGQEFEKSIFLELEDDADVILYWH